MAKALEKHDIQIKPVKTVIILNNLQSNLNLQNQQYLEKALQLSKSNIHIITIKKQKDNNNDLQDVIASINSISTFGKIKNRTIKTLLDKKYDLFIDFTNTSNIIEEYFSLAIQSDFRVGYVNDNEFYDLMIQVEKGKIKLFIDEMMKYLKIIGFSK